MAESYFAFSCIRSPKSAFCVRVAMLPIETTRAVGVRRAKASATRAKWPTKFEPTILSRPSAVCSRVLGGQIRPALRASPSSLSGNCFAAALTEASESRSNEMKVTDAPGCRAAIWAMATSAFDCDRASMTTAAPAPASCSATK
jgi:hypothetical protein